MGLIGRGVYTIREASTLTGVPALRIRRWTQGYTFKYKGAHYYSGPVIGTNVRRIDGSLAIDFFDLVEIRFLNAFRKSGVAWPTIHKATIKAREITGRERPFSTNMFRADGRTILLDYAPGFDDSVMLDLITDELAWKTVIGQFLYEDLDFNAHDEASRWWPLGKDRQVVLDPERSFGAPIVNKEGVPTRVLFNGYLAEGSERIVSVWYDVSEQAVEDAVKFEEQLAA